MKLSFVACFINYVVPAIAVGATPPSCRRRTSCMDVIYRRRGGTLRSGTVADCRAVFKPVTVKEVIVTVASTTSITAATVTVTIQSDSSPPGKAKRQADESLPQVTSSPDTEAEVRGLVPRARKTPQKNVIIANKKVPAYATAACRSLGQYALACICYGFGAITVTPTRTTTVTRTNPITTIATVGFDYISYLQVNGQDFCTSFNKYKPTVEVITSTNNVIEPATTSVTAPFTQTSIVETRTTYVATVPASLNRVKREGINEVNGRFEQRAAPVVAPVPTPAAIVGWKSADISSACLSVATGKSSSTVMEQVYSQTTTQTLTSTQIVSVTAVESATATAPRAAFTQIAGSLTSASQDEDISSRFTVSLPFGVSIFDSLPSPDICIFVGGTIWFEACEELRNLRFEIYSMGNNFIHLGRPEGIDYYVTGTAPSRVVHIRFYTGNDYYEDVHDNYTATVFENAPGVVQLDYYKVFEDGNSASVQAAQFDPFRVLTYQLGGTNLIPGRRVTFYTKTGQLVEGMNGG